MNAAPIIKRFQEIGFWDPVHRRPLCGWLPVIYGYSIVLGPAPIPFLGISIRGCWINGIAWTGPEIPIGAPADPNCPYARAFRAARAAQQHKAGNAGATAGGKIARA